MSQYNMSPLPDLQTGGTLEEIYENQKTIKNWLFQLNEQLRYNLYNMETENFTQETVDQLTSVSDDVKAQLQVMDGKITAAVTAADGRFSELEIDIDGITARVGDAEGNISQLQQTATSITSTVQDMQGNISVLQQTATSLTSAIEDAEGNISSLQQTATSLTSRVSDAEDNISSVEQTAEKIDWVVASGTSSSNFQLTSRMASLIADEVSIQTDNLVISSIRYGSSVRVQCSSDGVDIYSGNGNITMGTPSGGVETTAGLTVGGTLWAGAYSGNAVVGYGNIVCSDYQMGAYSVVASGYMRAPEYREGSDRKLKDDIENLDTEKCKALILGLNPVQYIKLPEVTTASTSLGTQPAAVNSLAADVQSGRYPDARLRMGFIAQDVQELVASTSWNGTGILVSSYAEDDGEETLLLNYTDIIAPLVKTVQWMEARITALEGDTA